MINRYELPDDLDARRLFRTLQRYMLCEMGTPEPLEWVFYDTVDWRVYRKGLILQQRRDNGAIPILTLREIEETEPEAEILVRSPVRFVSDFTAGPLKDRLSPLAGLRALLPVVHIRSCITSVRILDNQRKIVARLEIENTQGIKPQRGRNKTLSRRYASVISVRGYPKPAKTLSRLLRKQLALEPAPSDPLIEALAVVGRKPADYPFNTDPRLKPSQSAESAVKTLLAKRLGIMRVNEFGIRKEIDTESLHDFRVAIRQTRSALTQIKVFPERTVQRYRREFQWLQQIMGPARDIDVYLLTFESYQKLLQPNMRTALEPLRDFLEERRKVEYQRVHRGLDSARYNKLANDWHAFLSRASNIRNHPINATRSVREVASERIFQLHQRAIKEGRSISDDSPPEDLHELRKTCKKLRYLMEFFRSLYPQRTLKSLVRSLKQLQDNLGELNDFDVQSGALRSFSEQMYDPRKANTETLLAMGVLVGILEQQKRSVRAAFQSRFKKFDRKETAHLFADVFNTPRKASIK